MSTNGSLLSKDGSTLLQCPGGRVGTHTIEDGVLTIGPDAFQYCINLTNVVIPKSVTSIEIGGFYASGLTTITIPNGVTNIGPAAFNLCTNLVEVSISKTVKRIETWAFQECNLLTNVYVQGDAPFFGQYVFDGDYAARIYFLPGSQGWAGTPGPPALLWNPQIQTKDNGFGIGTNGFGFNVTGTVGIPVSIEACAAIGSFTWEPLLTIRLAYGQITFSDPQWTNYPARLYRIHSPWPN